MKKSSSCLHRDVSRLNGSVAVVIKIIKTVLVPAADTEVGALFMKAQQLVPLRVNPKEFLDDGWHQETCHWTATCLKPTSCKNVSISSHGNAVLNGSFTLLAPACA